MLQNQHQSAEVSGKISTGVAIAYALPTLGAIALFAPAISILQGMYNKYVGLELALIGTLLLIIRVTDALAGLYTGYLSDRYRQRMGTRKPLIIGSSLGLVFCGYFLFSPSPGVGGWYFLFWALGFYICNDVLGVNRIAWAVEMTHEPDARTRLFTYNGLFAQIGFLIAFGLPLLPIFEINEFTPQVLRFIALLSGAWLLITVLLALRYVPTGKCIPSVANINFVSNLKNSVSNKPFLVLIAFSCLSGIALGATVGIEFIVWDGYFGIGDKIAMVYVIVLTIGVISIPMINKLVRRFGKLPVLTVSMISYVMFPLAFLFVTPGEQAFFAIALIQGANGVAFSCNMIILPSLLADVVDYSTWKNRDNPAATYNSINGFIGKTSGALGAFLGLALAGSMGFDPASNSDPGVAKQTIHLVYCWIPAALQLAVVILIFKMPLNSHRNHIISSRLDARLQRAYKNKLEKQSGNDATIASELVPQE